MSNDKIAAVTGLPQKTVESVLSALLDFQLAVGIAHGDKEDTTRGVALLAKYPDLLRASAIDGIGGSSDKPVTYELEATIVQLESGEPANVVTAVIAAELDVLGLIDAQGSAHYREWATKWAR